MRALSMLCVAGLGFTGLANAQTSGSTILVLDGSGSMWGQIDGRAKITIAQNVVTGLLNELPTSHPLH